MLGLVSKNWPLKIVALIVSLSLWLHVQLNKPQLGEVLVPFSLQIQNLDQSKLVMTGPIPPTVKITATGLPEELKKLKGKDFIAFLDFEGAEPGLKEYSVRVNYPSDARVEWDRPNSIFVNLEPVAHSSRKVVVVQDESLAPAGFTLGEPSVLPEMVKLEGAQNRLDTVATVRALLIASQKVRPGVEVRSAVEALDKNGRVVPFVTAEPQEVLIQPTLTPIIPRHNLLVIPTWQGQPAFGYRVVRYSVTPNQVELTGDHRKLSLLSTIDTAPVNLSELKSTASFDVPLRLPGGAQLKGKNLVSVRVVIEKAPDPGPAPNISPGP